MRPTTIFYDERDVKYARKLDDRRFQWIEELGGMPLQNAALDVEGFVFGYQGSEEDYRTLVHDRPNIRDRPEEREELRHLDSVLERLDRAGASVPRPQSWILRIDDPIPADITYPVFVRTSVSSWKRGGEVSRAEEPSAA